MGTQAFGLVVYAKDLVTMATFYRQVLGLDAIDQDVDHVVLREAGVATGQEVVVLRIPDSIAVGIQVELPPARRESTAVKPVFFVTDLDDVGAAVTGLGGSMLPEQTRWRFADTVVHDGADPEGNVIQFRQSV